jgi:hypothetical protein
MADRPTMRTGIESALRDLFLRATGGRSEGPSLATGTIGLFGAPGSGLTTIRILAEEQLKAHGCSVFPIDVRNCRDEADLLTAVLKQLSGSDKKMRAFWRRYTLARFLKRRGGPALLSLGVIALVIGALTYFEPGWLGKLTGIKLLDFSDGQITVELTAERTILISLIVALLWVGREVLKTVGRSISDAIAGVILSKTPERLTWDEFRRSVSALRAGAGSQAWVIPVELQECEPDLIARILDVLGELIEARYRLVVIGDEAYLRSAIALRYKELLQLDSTARVIMKSRFDRVVTFPIRLPDPVAALNLGLTLEEFETAGKEKHETPRLDFADVLKDVIFPVIGSLRLNPRQVKRLVNECWFYLKYLEPDTEKFARLLVGAVSLSRLRPELLTEMLENMAATRLEGEKGNKSSHTLDQLRSEMKENASELENLLALLGVSTQ